jgi:hypothetical protein
MLRRVVKVHLYAVPTDEEDVERVTSESSLKTDY